MDSLSNKGYLKFHPDTLKYVRSQYNLDKPGEMDMAINVLEEWLKKQNHFTVKSFPRSYLERQIILDKGSVERAKNQMEKLFTMKTVVTQFLGKYDVINDFKGLRDVYIYAVIPKLTKDHYRVYAAKLIINKFDTNSLTQIYCSGILELEYIRSHEYCNGFVAVFDYRSINVLDLVAQLNITELKQIVAFVMEGYQTRLKGLHILTNSTAVELFVKIIKPMFSDKIGQRIHIHMSLDTLHEHISKDCLPEEFGGEQKSLFSLHDKYTDELSKKENIEYFREIRKAVVDEALRVGDNISKDDILGITGSFRTINVD